MILMLALFALFSGNAHANPFTEARQVVAAYEENTLCGGEGARCTTNLDCCRGSCQNRICRSGFIPPQPCKVNGSSCSRGSDCCSGFCLGTCQPRIEP